MSKNLKHEWTDSKVIDDVDYHEEDAKQFRKLLNKKEENAGEGTVSSMQWDTSSKVAL